jgi:CHAD domain-containing protein
MRGPAGRENTDSGRGHFGSDLSAAGQAIINDARQALAGTDLTDAEVVHELRKAFKRWRALLRLLAKPLGEPADRLRIEARDLMRSLASARDAQAALDALADLQENASEVPAPLSAKSMETVRTRLTAIRDAAELTSVTPELRARLLAYLDEAARALDSWPLQSIPFATIVDGLLVTYSRARHLIPNDWDGCDPEHLHALRRRVVEHRHQMELIVPLWPRFGEVWVEEAQRLRGRLGSCQDLLMLVNFTAPRQPLAPWRSRLAPMIEHRRKAHLKAAERLAGRLFAEKPQAFRRRVSSLWRVRHAKKT